MKNIHEIHKHFSIKSNACVQWLSLAFGAGSWIAITGFWVELPVLILRLPEGWKLASYITVMIQAANVGPLVYYVLRRKNWCSEVTAIHGQMLIGVVSCALLITQWNYTLNIWGEDRSVILLLAAFGLSIVDCTSSVTFLPFMARFHSCYLTPYLIGEGLSGFIPTVVALMQGLSDEHKPCTRDSDDSVLFNNLTKTTNTSDITSEHSLRFSVEVFFSSLLITLLISWFAFICLLLTPVGKRHECLNEDRQSRKTRKDLAHELNGTTSGEHEEANGIELISLQTSNCETGDVILSFTKSADKLRISRKHYWYLQTLMVWCCLTTFGLMPPIQPYSALPYGNAFLYYTVILAGLSYPGGCFVGLFFVTRSLRTINWLTLLGSLLVVYIAIAAFMSPFPPFISSSSLRTFGGTFIVFAWISFTALLSYVKTIITVILNDHGGNEALFWVGMFTQIGSALGAAVMFVAVNHLHWFSDDCFN